MNKIDFEKKINENPFKSITNILYEIILNDIINFDLIPNTKINEAQIAELFNVSRTPLRDALQLLINQGFLIKIINKGTFVAPFDSDDYFKLSKFRVQLESLVAGY
ncbi:MAG: GntR family transcriptional regulator, partial [Eubacteriaceae bacterium]